jgi:hypothetical protein
MTAGAWVTLVCGALLFGASVGYHAGIREERNLWTRRSR